MVNEPDFPSTQPDSAVPGSVVPGSVVPGSVVPGSVVPGTDISLVRIRRAELRDVRAIQAIDREAYPTPWSEKMTIDQITKSGRVHFVAVSNESGSKGNVVGHAGVLLLHDEAHVSTIAIASQWHRRGVARALLFELVSEARAHRAAIVSLEVRASNVAAIGLYRTAGFAELGLRPQYYQDNREDAVIMSLQL